LSIQINKLYFFGMKLVPKIYQHFFSFIFVALLIGLACASDDNLFIKIDQAYKSFGYNDVVVLCQKALKDPLTTNPDTLVQLYSYMGLSYYALDEMGPSYNKFYQLLKINPQYQLDPAVTPPKILRFFDEIKASMNQMHSNNVSAIPDTVFIPTGPDKTSIIYSFILPGSGHLREGFKTKGWILTSTALVTLGSSIYYIVETNNREKDYLNAIEKDIIEQKYQEYNDAYRLRNISLGLFAGVWLYSQIDLLFISSYEQNSKSGLNIQAGMNDSYTPSIYITYRF